MKYTRNTRNPKSIVLAVMLPAILTASWQKLNIPTDEGFVAVCALNEQIIFVSGDAGLWKTFDGTSWVIDSGYQSSMIYFVNDTLGFLWGSIITIDGGKTWVKGDTVNGTVGPISFPKGQSVIGYGLGYDHVSKTTDGGWHWSELSPFPDVYPGFDEHVNPKHICFPSDPDTGYVTAECVKKVDDSTFEPRMSYFKTTDGGQSWVINEEVLYDDHFNSYLVDFPENASVGYMSGSYLQGTTWIGCLYKTVNGGATWDTILVDTSMSMNDMSFPENDQVGYVIGSNKAYKTVNAGETWRKLEFGQDTILHNCHFVDNKLGFITGIKNVDVCLMPFDPGFVLKTIDGLIGIAEENWVDVKPQLIELSTTAFFSNELKVSYSSKSPGYLQASVFDASGRQVRSLEGQNVSGPGTISLPCSSISAGVYFVRVEFRSTGGNQGKTLRTVKIQ